MKIVYSRGSLSAQREANSSVDFVIIFMNWLTQSKNTRAPQKDVWNTRKKAVADIIEVSERAYSQRNAHQRIQAVLNAHYSAHKDQM